MDNLSHSLTGVLAGRLLPEDPADPSGKASPGRRPKTGRAIFWALLISANIPDIDVVANLFADPLTALHYHRGFTHSLVAVPLMALLSAFAVYLFSVRGGFARLWVASVIGVLFHLFLDLITPYGTQLLYPFSPTRFSLDWMFIIDPWFTGVLALLLAAGKIFPRGRKALGFVSLAFALAYVTAECRLQSEALGMFRNELGKSGRSALSASALPQPLSIFEWVGLATTDSGVIRQFITLYPERAVTAQEFFPHATDSVAAKAARSGHAGDYLRFARFPTLTSRRDGDFTTVEFRDLQFSVDPRIVSAVGMGERDVPFVLRMEFDKSEMLTRVTFNDRPVPLSR